jgi:hypothetical protein
MAERLVASQDGFRFLELTTYFLCLNIYCLRQTEKFNLAEKSSFILIYGHKQHLGTQRIHRKIQQIFGSTISLKMPSGGYDTMKEQN